MLSTNKQSNSKYLKNWIGLCNLLQAQTINSMTFKLTGLIINDCQGLEFIPWISRMLVNQDHTTISTALIYNMHLQLYMTEMNFPLGVQTHKCVVRQITNSQLKDLDFLR